MKSGDSTNTVFKFKAKNQQNNFIVGNYRADKNLSLFLWLWGT
jgi:hypothetical protein